MTPEQTTLIINTILRLSDTVNLMLANWNNENFIPPSVEELQANIEALMALPDLPEE
jgi:hypothetical protein